MITSRPGRVGVIDLCSFNLSGSVDSRQGGRSVLPLIPTSTQYITQQMRVVIQRVREASVSVEQECIARIGMGMLILVGIEDRDGEADVALLAKKISAMRIFPDEAGVMNRSIVEVGGDILLVSQFTLMASVRKGNRPSYIRASRPEHAVPLYEALAQALTEATGRLVQTGRFGADMQVSLTNDGPVTIFVDTHDLQ